MIQASDYVAAGKELLAEAKQRTIPYVPNGQYPKGLDCQSLCEYLLHRCGVERNWAGSNTMFRKALQWRGTIAECVKQFGHVPQGAWLFIVKADDSGAPAKYQGDGYGNASHVGVYLGGESAIHASSSRGMVAESVFKGKAIKGGWSHVGLPSDICYSEYNGNGGVMASQNEKNTKSDAITTPSVATKENYMQAKIYTPNGGSVNVRSDPSTAHAYIAQLSAGTTVDVISTDGDWSSINLNGKAAYVMTKFLSFEGEKTIETSRDVKAQLTEIIASLQSLVEQM